MKRRYIPHANQPAGPRPMTDEMREQLDGMTDAQLARVRIRTFWMRCAVCHRVEWLRYLAPCANLTLIRETTIKAGWTNQPPKCPTCSTKENPT